MAYRVDTDTDRHLSTGFQGTSKASAKETGKHKNNYREKIRTHIQIYGPSTCDEIERRMNLRHQTASCIIRFLTQDGLLMDSGERRMTAAGRKAIVWAISTPERPNAVQIALIPDPNRSW